VVVVCCWCCCCSLAQILRAWRGSGLIHGDIKPQNIVVQLPHDCSESVSCAVYYRGIKVFLIDGEGIVHLPRPRTTVTIGAGAGARCCETVS
jgi:alpha-D-ribose 1-methylphosphonate 5-triphosphate synthase subunit PhnH